MRRIEPKTLLFCFVASLVTALGASVVSGQESPKETAQLAVERNEMSPLLCRPGAGGFVYVGDVTAEEWVRSSGAAAAR